MGTRLKIDQQTLVPNLFLVERFRLRSMERHEQIFSGDYLLIFHVFKVDFDVTASSREKEREEKRGSRTSLTDSKDVEISLN